MSRRRSSSPSSTGPSQQTMSGQQQWWAIQDCDISHCTHNVSPQVVTDIHVSRSPIIIGWMPRAGAEKYKGIIYITLMQEKHFLYKFYTNKKYKVWSINLSPSHPEQVYFDIWIRPKFDEAEKQVAASFPATLFKLILSIIDLFCLNLPQLATFISSVFLPSVHRVHT